MNTVSNIIPEANSFPIHQWPEGIPPSADQVAQYETNHAYRMNVLRMVELLKNGATCTDFLNSQHPGLSKLGRWFRERRNSFKRTAHRGNDPVLDVWPNIAWHIGPCPLQGKQASVHRVDDLKGYRIGNLEWASKAVQALEKAEGTRKIKWQGKYISDRELVKKPTAIGIPCSVDRIKQFRKNDKAKFPSLDALHKAMLQKWGAYDTSILTPFKLVPDFHGEAQLEGGLFACSKWESIVKAHGATRLSPLEIQLKVADELEDELIAAIKKEGGYTGKHKKQLMEVRDFYRRVRDRLDNLNTKKAAFLADLIQTDLKEPDFHLQPTGFNAPAPITPTKPKFEAAPPKPLVQDEEDEEDDEPFFLSGEALAEHLKELGCS